MTKKAIRRPSRKPVIKRKRAPSRSPAAPSPARPNKKNRWEPIPVVKESTSKRK